jgi:hypothetical protein
MNEILPNRFRPPFFFQWIALVGKNTSRKKLISCAQTMLILLFFSELASGCQSGSQHALLPGTITAIAQEVSGTQTASAPTPFAPPTATLPPSPTPTLLPTKTQPPAIIVLTEQLTVYEGPGFDFLEIGRLAQEQSAAVLGRGEDCSWIKISSSATGEGWILSGDAWVEKNFICQQLPRASYRPKTGTLITNKFLSAGKGILEIDNGTSSDSLIILADLDGNSLAAVYIRKESIHELSGIPDGVYKIFFASGSGWNPEEKMFSENLNLQEFSDVVAYETLPERSTQWSLTLHPVEGGTAATNQVDEANFPDLE